MIDGAASVAAEDSGGVGVVDHHDRVILLRQVRERGQRADVAVHREDAVADQQLFAGLVVHTGQ
jgi:hypothetical protein